MCAINPVHKKRFIIDVYTSRQITKEKFEEYAMKDLLAAEILLNANGDLRFHLKETKQEAD
jgi:hypothetical protein